LYEFERAWSRSSSGSREHQGSVTRETLPTPQLPKSVSSVTPKETFDEYNAFQPDLIIVFNEHAHILTEAGAEGVPDFIVEILSPKTRRLDLVHKKRVYAIRGVRRDGILCQGKQFALAFAVHGPLFTVRRILSAQIWGAGQREAQQETV
jgi:Putative restriction endonuclease